MIPLLVGAAAVLGLSYVYYEKSLVTNLQHKVEAVIDPHKTQVGDVVSVPLPSTEVINREEVGAKITPEQLVLLSKIDDAAEKGAAMDFTVTKIGLTDRTANQNFMIQVQPNPTILDIEGLLSEGVANQLPPIRARFLSGSIRSLTRNGKKIF